MRAEQRKIRGHEDKPTEKQESPYSLSVFHASIIPYLLLSLTYFQPFILGVYCKKNRFYTAVKPGK